jgi:hypothetical protein
VKSSEQIDALATALAAAQAEMRNPAYDSNNPHFKSKFASLAAVRDTVTPTLSKHGIAVLQLLGFDDGRVTCETVLTHKSGQWISGTFAVAPTKPDAQGTGSAATYARRYALMAMVNVVGDEDDDGNAAVARPQAAQRPDDGESAVVLGALREAAMEGSDALAARFAKVPNGEAKKAVWAQHGASLKAAAAKADAGVMA